jgi:hypothetical protein
MPGGIIIIALSAIYSLFLLIKVQSILGQKFIIITGDNIWNARGIQISDTTYFFLWVIALAGFAFGGWLIFSDFREKKSNSTHDRSDIKKCPKCAETIKLEAKVCKHCGHEFSLREIAEEKEWQRKLVEQTSAGKFPFPANFANNKWVIFGLSGPLAGKDVELTSAPLIIGRDPGASNLIIPPPSQSISKRHCVIRFDNEEGNILLEDLGSKNGTFFYGGKRLDAGRSYILENGDRFYLAEPDILFELQSK